MTATAILKETFSTKTIVPALLGLLAFAASHFLGVWASRYHKLLRYAPGVLLMAVGVWYARKEGSRLHGVGITTGAGIEVLYAAAEQAGIAGKLGLK